MGSANLSAPRQTSGTGGGVSRLLGSVTNYSSYLDRKGFSTGNAALTQSSQGLKERCVTPQAVAALVQELEGSCWNPLNSSSQPWSRLLPVSRKPAAVCVGVP